MINKNMENMINKSKIRQIFAHMFSLAEDMKIISG